MKYILFLLSFYCSNLSASWEVLVTDVSMNTGVPKNVLNSICTHESQSFYKGKRQPWPWTIASNYKGLVTSKYFKNKEDAVIYVRSLMRLGVENIDIGLCQISWYWHGSNFNSVEEMIDPKKNLTYAANYLKSHYKEVSSWSDATGRYHSPSNSQRAAAYISKVLK